ncbi:uncharacterized protein LOC121977339 [Zingiber officinale]|uniref:uncharacterized protein LOC121977339 n=1 Tax=Zingiber officinale TaxID=94328 RepID=UPI001C4C0CD8|nr:uncharacterized protein LOC121977339 [Zingiber officinale]
MANAKYSALAVVLLLTGSVVFGLVKLADAKICPEFCLQAEYMTCNSTGGERLKAACNCCFAPQRGCSIHLLNGRQINCT